MTLQLLISATAAGVCLLVTVLALSRNRGLVPRTFAIGMAALAAEAALGAMSLRAGTIEEFLAWQRLRLLATGLVPCGWLLFSVAFARSDRRQAVNRWRWAAALMFALPVALITLFAGSLWTAAGWDLDSPRHLLRLGWAGRIIYVTVLVGSVAVLANLERTLRASTGSMRWFIKFITLGVGGLFAIRIYTASQTLLFVTADTSLQSLSSGALLVASAFMAVGLYRARGREVEIYVSPAALYNSVTVGLVGAYLIGVGLLAKAVTWRGGVEALPLATFVVFVALLGLTTILLSDELRLALRRFLSRHFRRPEYDYRTVWLDFTRRTASIVEVKPLALAIARMTSETLRVPSVTVWLLDEGGEAVMPAASTLHAEADANRLANRHGAMLAEHSRGGGDPVDLATGSDHGLAELEDASIVVPLKAGGEPVGVMVLGLRGDQTPLTLEDRDLLKALADQGAAGLRNLTLSQRLVRAKEMEAFQSLSAFFVHDLKNLASKLSLTMQNLPRHYDDPEFRRDLLALISRSVSQINDMCGRLSPLARGLEFNRQRVDLAEIVQSAVSGLSHAVAAQLVCDTEPPAPVNIDPEQVQKVLMNLVLNAGEAVGPDGVIRVAAGRQDGWAYFSVSDNGCGMSKEFVARSLFQPFKTTKEHGLGIGLFHSRKIVEAHRGRIEVESEEGRGSTFRVYLPQQGS